MVKNDVLDSIYISKRISMRFLAQKGEGRKETDFFSCLFSLSSTQKTNDVEE